MFNLFLNNLFVLFSVMSPVFCLFIVKLPFLNCLRWFLISELFFIFLCVFILFGYEGIVSKTVPSMLIFYPLSIVLFNLFFTFRFGVERFAKILSLSLMLGFILTELHEAPVFFFSIFGLYGHETFLVWYLPQIYLLVVGYFTVKLGGLKRNWKPIVLFLGCLVSLFIIYIYDPKIDVHPIPIPLSFFKRVLCFTTLSIIFYFWGDLND